MTNDTKTQPRGAQEPESVPRVELDEEAMAGWARADGGSPPPEVPDWVKRL